MVAFDEISTLMRYLEFKHPSRPYYEKSDVSHDDFSSVGNPSWEGVTTEVDEQWARPRKLDVLAIPNQGWKIHVSTTLENAEHTLSVAGSYCVANRLAWKYIRSPTILLQRNSKYGDRSASGKFITIYPPTNEIFEQTLHELGDLLEGLPSPYVLSDVRWRSGPLYVRYGGFVLREMRLDSGEKVACIEDPDGNLVVDERRPSFRPPPWVEFPSVLQSALKDRNASTLKDFPYRDLKALHFSNGGGVYVGTSDESGHKVALREARPNAGLDLTGADAVARLEREKWAFEKLATVDAVPNLVDYRRGHEHYFLVRDFVEGAPLARLRTAMNPVLFSGQQSRGAYATWAEQVLKNVTETLAQLHECGVVFGDLHPGNILVDEDGNVSFIDFEGAKPVDDPTPQHLAGPGYRAPSHVVGPAIDLFALGRLRIGLFAPLEGTFDWIPGKISQTIDYIAATFPVSEDFISDTRAQTKVEVSGDDLEFADLNLSAPTTSWEIEDGIDSILDSLAAGIMDSVETSRLERPFPGDPAQFFAPMAGLTMAYGSAGVLWSLLATGHEVPEDLLDHLSSAADKFDDGPLGLYDGLAGIAYLLAKTARPDAARSLTERILAQDDLMAKLPDLSLGSGVAGVALCLFGMSDELDWPEVLSDAIRLADHLAAVDPRNLAIPGMLQGSTGVALCLITAYERTSDSRYLDAAGGNLSHGISILNKVSDGDLAQLPPSLIWGNGGVGVVLKQFLAHHDDHELSSAEAGLLASTEVPFSAQAGLFDGLAGVVAARSSILEMLSSPDPIIVEQVRSLALHSVVVDGHLAMTGPYGFRLSSDLATGAAGTLLALHAAASQSVVALPFLKRSNEMMERTLS